MSPSSDNIGKIRRKYAKYKTVKSLLAPTYGAAAAREPRNISVRKTPIKNQKKILCCGAYGAKTVLVAGVLLST